MSYTKLPHNHHNETDHTALLEQLDDIQHFKSFQNYLNN